MNPKNLLKNIPLLLFGVFFLLGIFGNRIVPVLILIFALFFIINKIIPVLKGVGGKANNMAKTIDLDSVDALKKVKKILFSGLGLVLVIWLFFASVQIIDAGETGVYSLFGRVKSDELKSGFHLVIPLAKVTRMSIRTEEYTMSIAQGEGKRYAADAITSLTKEGLSVDLDMTVFYHLQEDRASDVYSELGTEYEEKIIRPTIRTAIRDIIAQYEAKDIYSAKREEASQKIQENLVTVLDSRGITVESVLLRNVALPANLANAIQEKLQAEQEAEKYDFILAREKKEKERKIIEAEGQRDAQKIINESLTTNYLYYLYISDLKSREGTIYVPTSPDTGLPMFRDLGR